MLFDNGDLSPYITLIIHFGKLLTVSHVMVDDPPRQLYCHELTEPLEIDKPELLDPKYGRQN